MRKISRSSIRHKRLTAYQAWYKPVRTDPDFPVVSSLSERMSFLRSLHSKFLCFAFISLTKHWPKVTWETPRSPCVIEGRNLEAGTEGELSQQCSLVAFSVFAFQYGPGPPAMGAPPTVNWALLQAALIKKMPPGTCSQPIRWRQFLSWYFLFPDDSRCVSHWHTINQYEEPLTNRQIATLK